MVESEVDNSYECGHTDVMGKCPWNQCNEMNEYCNKCLCRTCMWALCDAHAKFVKVISYD